MNIRKEIRKTIREQVEMDSVNATEEIEELRGDVNDFLDVTSKRIEKLRPYFVLTDKNYGTECVYHSSEVVAKLKKVYDAIEDLSDEFYKAK